MGRVLLVEDDRYIAMALQIRLNAQGYRVSLCEGLQSARSQLASDSFDLAVVDINLVDGNGLDLISEMKQNPLTATLPAIAVSAGDKQGLSEEAIASGAYKFLAKPFTSQELLCVMDSLIR